jgi:hypothetical protein
MYAKGVPGGKKAAKFQRATFDGLGFSVHPLRYLRTGFDRLRANGKSLAHIGKSVKPSVWRSGKMA